MKVGYAWWGFMADKRWKDGKEFSSPDGSLLHSFSIINGFLDSGDEVYRLYPDRDEEYVKIKKQFAFASFSSISRRRAYNGIIPNKHIVTSDTVSLQWPQLDLVLLEWRMPTDRNKLSPDHVDFDPDLMLQHQLIEHYTKKGIPIIALDLDYRMSLKDDKQVDYVLEPGFSRGLNHHIDIPFIMSEINQFQHLRPRRKIVYIGSRIDRDEDFNRFFGKGDKNIQYEVWGNWIEKGRDSKTRWPHINFMGRAQPYQMRDAYAFSTVTPLLMTEKYKENGFMPIRIIETILFGSIPLLPSDFCSHLDYVPRSFCAVQNEKNMLLVANHLDDINVRATTRNAIIEKLQRHDVKHFIHKIKSII